MAGGKYVSALSLRWLTPFYDALIEGPMSALHMRRDLLAYLGDLSGKKVLHVGSGTGTLAVMMKQAYPASDITGLDGDPQILSIARSKAARHGLDIRFSEAMSYAMPYPDGSFDFVLTSLMLHHLDGNSKRRTVAEMYRVLRPGGLMFGIDFAAARGPLGRGLKPLTRRMERMAENVDGLLPVMIKEAGFRDYRELCRYLAGSLALFRASKP